MRINTLLRITGFLACLGVAAYAQATSISYELDTEFSGATAPEGTAPWLTATFDDGGSAGSVTLTLEASLTDNEFVSQFYFNFDDAQNVASLVISSADPYDSISQGQNAFQADGDGKYDVLIDFANSGSDRFMNSEVFTFNITGTGILATDFDFLSMDVGGNGPFYAAAHVQGIGPNDADSGWIAPGGGREVPEPASLLLLGAGLLGLLPFAGVRRRRKI